MLGVCLAAVLLLGAVSAAHAGPYAASAVGHDSVMVSGTWSSVLLYSTSTSWSAVGPPLVSQSDDQMQSSTPVDLFTTASDTYGLGSSSILVNAPLDSPAIGIHASANVDDVPEGTPHYATGYSEGGADMMTSGATQSVTVTVDYSYDLDLTQAGSNAYAFLKIYVGFWDSSGNQMLTPDDEFVEAGQDLYKVVQIENVGSSTGTVTGSKSWNISVTEGSVYSFWSLSRVEVYTESEPVPVEQTNWGSIKSLYK